MTIYHFPLLQCIHFNIFSVAPGYTIASLFFKWQSFKGIPILHGQGSFSE